MANQTTFRARFGHKLSILRDYRARKEERQKNLVVCTWGLGPGGAERQWIYLAQGLKKLGHSVTILTYESLTGSSAHYFPLVRSLGIPHFDAFSCPLTKLTGVRQLEQQLRLGAREIQIAARLATAFKQLRPSAVIAQLDEPNVLAGIAARLSGTPRFIASFRNHNPTHFDWIHTDWLLPGYRYLARWDAVRYSANSTAVGESYSDWIGIESCHIETIPNMLGPPHLWATSPNAIAAVKAELGIAEGKQLVLGVFRHHPEKRPFLFLEVARKVLENAPQTIVALAGEGPLTAAMNERICELHLQDQVRLLGPRRDVPALMGAASVLLHTSRFEGMSNVVMEAQAAGLPVVGCDIPGVREVVDDSRSAILIRSDDAAEFSCTLLTLLNDHRLRLDMAEAARSFSKSRFDQDTISAQYQALVQSI